MISTSYIKGRVPLCPHPCLYFAHSYTHRARLMLAMAYGTIYTSHTVVEGDHSISHSNPHIPCHTSTSHLSLTPHSTVLCSHPHKYIPGLAHVPSFSSSCFFVCTNTVTHRKLSGVWVTYSCHTRWGHLWTQGLLNAFSPNLATWIPGQRVVFCSHVCEMWSKRSQSSAWDTSCC